ncbi:MAG: hypothetical protein R2769_05355 [Saprospiraceae bacterium]
MQKQAICFNLQRPPPVLLLATALAVGASFSKIWSTYGRYAKDTMRGEPIMKPKVK